VNQHHHATADQATVALERHRERFAELHDRLTGCFRRQETRQTFRRMSQGLLMELEDANCWSLAEAIGDRGPHRLQHLLSRAVWDEQGVLDHAAAWAVDYLDDGDGILIADETGDAKSSTDAVGAARQYSGALGGVALCQVAVHLTFASRRGHTLIDRRLYLSRGWAADEERRELTGVPEEIGFATKSQLATAMLTRAVARGVRASFFAADEVYGTRAVRSTCRTLGLGYAIAVRSTHTISTPGGRMTAAQAAGRLPQRAWQRMRTGTGSKGVRSYDWAWIEVTADDAPEGGDDEGLSVLVLRRHRYTREVSYFRCWSPTPVPLARLVVVICRRWWVEEDFQACKETTRLDQGQVTCWASWHRWSVVALVAYAFLAVCAALERRGQADRDDPDEAELIPISCHELLRLFRALILPPPRRDPEHLLWWSRWRRRHQHRARACHHRWHAYAETIP
jgi:SRSO17 transposase